MNILNEKFSSGDVVKAADVSNHTLQSWLKRDIILGHKDQIEGGGSPGHHRRYSFFNLMEIATAKALIDCGISDLAVAFGAAREFAHTGDGAFLELPDRSPSFPYHTTIDRPGRTLLCVSGEKCHVAFWVLGEDALANIRRVLGYPLSFALLDMTALFDRVVSRLGYHPEVVLEGEYGG